MKGVVAAFLVISLTSSQPFAQPIDQDAAAKIDPLFKQFNNTSPGCAVGVEQNGKTLFSKGYGLADLEHDIPLTPQSVFYMASVSKQFTALTILLLADDGKLQLTDSIRKFIPELPDYANGVTIYQLLTHTSGVRDYLSLGGLAGLSNEFVYTDDNALKLISRQEAPNFAPGSEFLYSNSGYFLLSLVVKRITGQPLNGVAHEKIFDPLGMKATRFQHDHSALIPAKAVGYEVRGKSWHTSNSTLDVVGDGGLYSSIDDMMLWMKNIDAPTLGAKALAIMETPGKLNNGTPIDYGMGLEASNFRGLKAVEHGGALAGYRTEDLWFPEQRLSVVVLCNSSFAFPQGLARQTAEVYLSPQMEKSSRPAGDLAPPVVSITEQEIQAKVGMYRNKDGNYINIIERDGKLFFVERQTVLVPTSKVQFSFTDAPDGLVATFDHGEPASYLETASTGAPPVRYERASPVNLGDEDRKTYVGNYESRELGATYRISSSADGLSLQIADRPSVVLRSTGVDRMRGGAGLEILFNRDSRGDISGFSLNAGRVRNLQFRRVAG